MPPGGIIPLTEHHEAGQVAAYAAESVRHPRAETRPPLLTVPAVPEVVRVWCARRSSTPIERITARFVGALSDVREQIADRQPALAVLLELPRLASVFADVVELRRLDLRGERLAVVLLQRRLRVEGIDLTRPAVHEQEEITLFALGAKCGFLGANGSAAFDGASARASSDANSAASAAAPKPLAERSSIWRRESMARPGVNTSVA